MRWILLFLFSAVSLPSAAAEEEQTLLGTGSEYGFYLGPVVRFSEVLDEFAVLPGLRGGWLIDHTFSLGLGGYGLANDIQIEGMSGIYRRDLEFGYGGLELEYIYGSHRLIHFTMATLIGAGGVSLPNNPPDEGEAVFVLEPRANLVLNVAPVMRVGVGMGYRWVTGTNSEFYDSASLSTGFAGIELLFGRF